MPVTDATFTIDPEPIWSIWGMTFREQRKGPFRLIARTSSHSCSDISVTEPSLPMPALLINTSTRPNSCRLVSTIRSTSSGLVTSALTGTARPPLAPASTATASAFAPSRSATTTTAPSRTNPSEIALPMPEPPPVTMQHFPVSRIPCPPSFTLRHGAARERDTYFSFRARLRTSLASALRCPSPAPPRRWAKPVKEFDPSRPPDHLPRCHRGRLVCRFANSRLWPGTGRSRRLVAPCLLW